MLSCHRLLRFTIAAAAALLATAASAQDQYPSHKSDHRPVFRQAAAPISRRGCRRQMRGRQPAVVVEKPGRAAAE